jgi:hypothetical protein
MSNQEHDAKLDAEFRAIVNAPDAWPTLASENIVYYSATGDLRREINTTVADVVNFVHDMRP